MDAMSSNPPKDKSKEIETVFLDSLDGFGFETLCQRIFEKSGWGTVEHIGMTGDSGRDLIIHSNKKGKIIVECKHQPRTSIGRPIVQKLHSAIISSNSKNGIIVTTGKFSKQAIEYAKNLSDGTTIKLFDMHKIVELAQKGGISIVDSGEDLRVFTFPISSPEHLKKEIGFGLISIQSSPKKFGDMISDIKILETTLNATYEAIVDVDQTFATSAGILHQLKINSQSYFFDGKYGHEKITSLENFSTRNATVLFDGSKIHDNIHVGQFQLDKTTLSSMIKEQIIRKETISVQYRGKNNVTYRKTCVPNKKNIRINDVNQILLPEYRVELLVDKRKYLVSILETKNKLNILSTGLFTCKLCNHVISKDDVLLCNSCGNICHKPNFKPHHSYVCEECEKTLCKECTYYVKKFLIMKKKLCKECAENHSKNLKRISD